MRVLLPVQAYRAHTGSVVRLACASYRDKEKRVATGTRKWAIAHPDHTALPALLSFSSQNTINSIQISLFYSKGNMKLGDFAKMHLVIQNEFNYNTSLIIITENWFSSQNLQNTITRPNLAFSSSLGSWMCPLALSTSSP